jgi:hypothetical protein
MKLRGAATSPKEVRAWMNKEKYSDPTADQAIAHVMREYRKKKKQEGDSIGKEPKRKSRGSPQAV